ncbi:prepilin peptidase dependent protein C [Cricetibacter osteomyelitidis]|uniref:Prepilin peptidase dependent protein C n=1 Tax=Cricetibacter osteomyelitidis TaxID=1521931 RepID=A0A4R2SIZ6_9PAST|nr:DUF5374 domain-containing protein [Cricetibacter osteomyelitidis]TCP89767.1 prepilin peptidase dependent protein C [Cricetibacter osteomyelitidis]
MISNRFKLYKGMSLVSLLFTLTVFSGIFFIVNQWTASQRQIGMETYQRYQAIQIAENQKQRQFVGLPCQSQVSQNQLKFDVLCSVDKVKVRYFFQKKWVEL